MGHKLDHWSSIYEGLENGQSRGRIFSRVQPFYEPAVSDLDP